MATLVDDTDDLSTCCVCYYSYDENERKPKILLCGHTLCLKCIKVNNIKTHFKF